MQASSAAVAKPRLATLVLMEYRNLSRILPAYGRFPSQVLPALHEALHLPVVPDAAIGAVHEKWVYVFGIRNGVMTLQQEGFVQVEDKVQKIQFVDWSGPQRAQRQKESTRKASGPKVAGLTIDLAQPSWIILSPRQLPLLRIHHYQTNRTALEERAQAIVPPPAKNVRPGPLPTRLLLVDPVSIAVGLHSSYVAASRAWSEAQGDFSKEHDPKALQKKMALFTEQQARRMLFAILPKLAAAEPDVKEDWVDWKKFEADRKKSKDRELTLIREALNAERVLFEWKTSQLYRLAWFDLSCLPELEEDALRLVVHTTSPTETKYLQWELSRKDSWYQAIVTGTDYVDARFQFGRKLATTVIDGHLADFLDQWVIGRCLAKMSASGLSRTQRRKALEGLLDEIEDVVVKRKWASLIPELDVDRRTVAGQRPRRFFTVVDGINGVTISHHFSVFGKGIAYTRAGSQNEIRTAADRDSYLAAQKQKREKLAKLGTIGKSLFLGLESYNLAIAYGKLVSTDPTDKKEVRTQQINLAGSVADLVGSVEFLAEARMVGKETKTLSVFGVKLGEKVVKKGFLVFAIVGAAADLGGAALASTDPENKGRYLLIAGNAVIGLSAIAGLASGIGGLMALAGSAAALATLAGPLGWAALILFVIGTAIVYWWTESDLETWCRDSPWGQSSWTRRSQYSPKTKDSDILRELLNILSALEPKCRLEQRSPKSDAFDVVIDIRLGPIFNEGMSSISLSLLTRPPRGEVSVRMPIEFSPGTGQVVSEGGKPVRWIRRIPLETLRLDRRIASSGLGYKLEHVVLKLNGPGDPSSLFPDAAGSTFEGVARYDDPYAMSPYGVGL